ncbi:FAR1-related protein [Sesbania bispinosa]|nr:FAR1-related protein [Sesbania bispinosa]
MKYILMCWLLPGYQPYLPIVTTLLGLLMKRQGVLVRVDDIFNLQLKYKKKGDPSSTSSSARKIGDPTVVKTKGAPKKRKFSKKRKRHCSNFSGTGHTIRTCPKVGGIDVKADSDDETSPSERSDNNKSNDSKGKEKEKVDPVSTSKVKKVKEIKEKDSSQKQANEVVCRLY